MSILGFDIDLDRLRDVLETQEHDVHYDDVEREGPDCLRVDCGSTSVWVYDDGVIEPEGTQLHDQLAGLARRLK